MPPGVSYERPATAKELTAAPKAEVDRTLIRENLRLTPHERLVRLQELHRALQPRTRCRAVERKDWQASTTSLAPRSKR